ncbi:MAG TPA: glycosyltransferase family 2 protein [Planctomycetaceae bacterium]|nr:glycosyltransferase family 2 protein [Planctomycetaceae bacterium]
MWILGLSVVWAGTIGWLIVRAVDQFRAYRSLQPERRGELPTVAVLVPARNEEHHIGRCLEGLLLQNYPAECLQIYVVNDNSSDHTGDIIADFARLDSRVHLLQGEPLPADWMGKPHACWQAARAADADWLCFIDADTSADPRLLSAAVTHACEHELDMLSLEPFQVLGSFWERVVIPSGLLVLACSQDMRQVSDPQSPEAFANGQFILIRRAVYEAVGGHAAAPRAVCEDRALALHVKHAGGRLEVLGAESLIRTRMYSSLRTLWSGLAKNVTETIGGLGRTACVAIAGLVIAWASVLLPIAAIWSLARHPGFVSGLALSLSLAGTLALVGVHVGAARHLRIPWTYGLLYPLGYTVAALIALQGVFHRLNGRVSWKGRTYALEPDASSGMQPTNHA